MESYNVTKSTYKAEYNEYLDGYVLTFKNGHVGQTQYGIEQNRLHADYGESILAVDLCNEYGYEDLTPQELKEVEDFCKEMNTKS